MKRFVCGKFLITTILILILVVSYSLFCFAEEEYPTKPIRIIVPYGTGGSTDLSVRAMQVYLKEALGAPAVIIENKPGGNALMGTVEFLKRKADGYTLFFNESGGMVLNMLMAKDAQYEMTDFAPVVGVVSDPRTFFVKKSSPYNTIEDLIKDIRKRPNEISLAFTPGSGQWLEMWLKKELNLPVNLVGFSGGGKATPALIGGHVDAYMDAGQGRVPFKEEIKAIGVVYPERSKNWPDAIPILELDLFKEEGIDHVPGLEAAMNNIMWVRKEVKEDYPERFYKLVSAFYEVAKNLEFQKAATEIGLISTLVWWPPSKCDEVVASAVEMIKGDAELLEAMKE